MTTTSPPATAAVKGRNLTARGVRTRLTRAGVDHSELAITQTSVTSRVVDFDRSGPWATCSVVEIRGPKDARRAAFRVLFDAGLTVAPYPDVDHWSWT